MTSPRTLYNLDLASFTMGGLYNEADAIGFIRLFGLPMKVEALLRGKGE